MRSKISERENAIALRQKGFSYREILEKVPVAKSTLSLWLRNVGLSKKQEQRLTQKKIASMLRGAESRRKERIVRTEKIKSKARIEINRIPISKQELWLMGIMLYWAEGSKEKTYGGGCRVDFSNSDPRMVSLFLKWLFEICKISKEDVRLVIYIHQNNKERIHDVIEYWAEHTKFSKEHFSHIQYKKHNPKTKRKNIGENYFGLLRITVSTSIDFNRKIAGWIEGVCQQCGVV